MFARSRQARRRRPQPPALRVAEEVMQPVAELVKDSLADAAQGPTGRGRAYMRVPWPNPSLIRITR